MSNYEGREERRETRLFGAPEPENFKETLVGRALAQSAPIHYTDAADQDRLLALEKLAIDIFNDPNAARAFAVNPDAYMESAGFPPGLLKMDSLEVRVAFALGDPDVRQAALNGEVDAFIEGIRRQGIEIRPTLSPIIVFEVAALMSAVVVSWAAVGYSVLAGMMVAAAAGFVTEVAAWGRAPSTVEEHVNLIRRLAESIGGTQAFIDAVGTRVFDQIVEEYARLHAQATETLASPPSPEGSTGEGGQPT